jgi:hypothetical protein
MQHSLSFCLACNPNSTYSCQQEREKGRNPQGKLKEYLLLFAPDAQGKPNQKGIQDDGQENNQNACPYHPTPIYT